LLLRHSATSSDFSEFAPGTSFSPVLVDQTLDPSKIKKLVFSCGKHVITLQEAIRKLKITDTAIISVEQLCPFPVHDLESAIKRYSNATSFFHVDI
jgi:probable 2-oxoglutarate dehydrogenase E1 component DHKTD1